MRTRGQTAVELAILIAAIVIAAVAMQVYTRRAVQGRLRMAVDSIGEQYDPNATTSEFDVTQKSNSTTVSDTSTKTDASGIKRTSATTYVFTHYDNTTRVGNEYVAAP
ncbi:MAG: hypothetical protein V1863_01260 [Candidatus Omnitrophota bacterium]